MEAYSLADIVALSAANRAAAGQEASAERQVDWVKAAIAYNKARGHRITPALLKALVEIVVGGPLLVWNLEDHYPAGGQPPQVGRDFVELVHYAQQRLFRGQPEEQDGKLGPRTLQAIRQWRDKHGVAWQQAGGRKGGSRPRPARCYRPVARGRRRCRGAGPGSAGGR